jgi:hypothetical protein
MSQQKERRFYRTGEKKPHGWLKIKSKAYPSSGTQEHVESLSKPRVIRKKHQDKDYRTKTRELAPLDATCTETVERLYKVDPKKQRKAHDHLNANKPKKYKGYNDIKDPKNLEVLETLAKPRHIRKKHDFLAHR